MPEPAIENFRFADNLDGEPVVALGLPAPRLILAGLGATCSWALAEVPSPAPVHLGAACLLALTTAILAWGKVQGVSLARWTWLALCFAGRTVTAHQVDRHQWVDTDSGSDCSPRSSSPSTAQRLVAFVSVRPGVGCTALCHAVANQLRVQAGRSASGSHHQAAAPLPVGAELAGGRRTELLLCDWGSGPPGLPYPGRVSGLVLVWDGAEVFGGQLMDHVAALRRSFPGTPLLVAVNRAGPAAGLAARIAGAGARLAATIPVDDRLGHPELTLAEAAARPSAEGVRTLVREVVAASRSW
ncbi:MAG TPA: hypothetical protein VNH38_06650 [Candidatus Dormibacteraeota bacterium]|nr:hypothetical protein [Candidatus Dormibacteraeota bacterium]